MAEKCEDRDLIRKRLFLWMWVWTAALIVGQVLLPQANYWFAMGLLLSWAGFCGVNAVRCRRMHCAFTAPILLLAAAALTLLKAGLLSFSGDLFNVVVLGAVVLSCVAEKLFGKYLPASTGRS